VNETARVHAAYKETRGGWIKILDEADLTLFSAQVKPRPNLFAILASPLVAELR
jgi:hypothetical protein